MKRRTLLAILVVFGLITLACSPCGLASRRTSKETAKATATAPAKATAKVTLSATRTADSEPTHTPQPSQESPPTAQSGGDEPTVVDLDELDSYRSRMTIRVQEKDGDESYEITTTTEWVRDPQAMHVVIESEIEGFSFEAITIVEPCQGSEDCMDRIPRVARLRRLP